MKADHYLNLCLEQAEMSPLHHRHGCVVVKGGKIIGKGFNDYRPGFDGGALKTGSLSTKASMSEKQKQKKTNAQNWKHDSKNGFKPFENTVGLSAKAHHHANQSLTMHSEMMAINSALESSGTSAAMNLSYIKPPGAPSRDSKRKRQLRRDVVNAYAQRVCYETFGPQVQQRSSPAQTDEWRFEACTYRCNATEPRTKPESSSPSRPSKWSPEDVRHSGAKEAAV
ncbi:hypothetical protein F5Y04DRAFT_71637 [Hypomontagnella monticulosa]|nr:hypothetical protein F5Y04DRAFT_71637 [Hypomontagnella monticulosa]